MAKDQKESGKNPWRFLFLAIGSYGALKLLGGIWVNVLYFLMRTQSTIYASEAYSVGIIGGADGPTAVFVTTPVWISYILPVVCLIVGAVGFLKLRKK